MKTSQYLTAGRHKGTVTSPAPVTRFIDVTPHFQSDGTVHWRHTADPHHDPAFDMGVDDDDEDAYEVDETDFNASATLLNSAYDAMDSLIDDYMMDQAQMDREHVQRFDYIMDQIKGFLDLYSKFAPNRKGVQEQHLKQQQRQQGSAL